MKQKINARVVALSVSAVLITMICITVLYYELFCAQVKKDLRIQTNILAATNIEDLMEKDNITKDKSLRITWISQDGKVLFDNDANPQELKNHMDRPEVQDAFAKGYGESVRKSDTLNMRTFYYAVLLEDGTVLRVATEARSITSVFLFSTPFVFIILVLILLCCILTSHFLTKQLVEPIEVLAENLDNVGFKTPYPELEPFIKRIHEQHDNILSAAKSRQDFTANVSHELKTPITAISGYAEIIENRMVDEEQEIRFAKEIQKHAKRLLSLVNDILELSELEHREDTYHLTEIDLFEVAKERVETFQKIRTDKNVSIYYSGNRCTVLSNKGLLTELIDNLIQNAIRYNVENGSVYVTVSKKEHQSVLTVEDTGIGIPEEDQGRVFERFYRVDKSRSRETGGTGLGLAIVKHIVEIHDGKIALESELGRGTKITIYL